MIDGEEMQAPQDTDDLREVSSDNGPASIPQKEVFDNASIGGSSQVSPRPNIRTTRAQPPAHPAQLKNRGAGEDISPVAPSRLPRFVLGIVLLALGAAATLIIPNLIPKPRINAAADQNPVVSDAGSKELSADSVQTEQSGRNVQTEPRLILEQNLSGNNGALIPLGTQVSGEAPGLALEIGGLPEGMTISKGRPLGTGAWRILASDVADATINPPPGFAGAIDLTVELRLADDTLIDHGSLHREWDRPASTSIASERTVSANSADHETRTATGPDQNAVNSAADSQLDPAQIDLLIERSQAFLSEGDVVSARIQLQRAAEVQDARAALALGATYDPIMLAILQVHGVAADVSKARYWYQKAKEFGSPEAPQRLRLLENVRP